MEVRSRVVLMEPNLAEKLADRSGSEMRVSRIWRTR